MFQELTVGERLKMARKAKGLLQDEVGRFINVGKSQISNIEKGHGELTRGNAIVLSENLGIGLDWLLTGEGQGPEIIRGAQQGGNVNTNTQTVRGVGNTRPAILQAETGSGKTSDLLSKYLTDQLDDLKKRYDKLEEKYERIESERDKLKEDNFKMALELAQLKREKE